MSSMSEHARERIYVYMRTRAYMCMLRQLRETLEFALMFFEEFKSLHKIHRRSELRVTLAPPFIVNKNFLKTL